MMMSCAMYSNEEAGLYPRGKNTMSFSFPFLSVTHQSNECSKWKHHLASELLHHQRGVSAHDYSFLQASQVTSPNVSLAPHKESMII
jgi:hypothetical protein